MPATPTIQVLSDAAINQIAAGEVVERPASVLKELMENALDAGAKTIEVAVTAAGRRLIGVADDGGGMSRDDAVLCLERHATSKIRAVSDLDRIGTLGFRGEALAAIAAVSRLTLLTRPASALGGTRVRMHGGRLLDVQEQGSPVGTRVEVRDLFFNVPARRRFLRSDNTEAGHLRAIFQTYALAHPALRLRLASDGGAALEWAPAPSLAERLAALFGVEWIERLRPVDAMENDLRIRGFVGLPLLHRADRGAQYVFINGRPAGAPVVGYALRQAYADVIPRGRHPVVVLFLDLDPAGVDVNVHPTKSEVRFRQSALVRDTLLRTVRAALAQGEAIPPVPRVPAPAGAPPPALETPRLPWSGAPATGPKQPGFPPPASVPPAREPEPCPPEPSGPWEEVVLLGRLAPPYALLRTREGLLLLDVHAAHTRVLYEDMLRQARTGTVAVQGLLDPVVVEMMPREAAAVREHLDLLRNMGFGMEPFGEQAFRVDAMPACLGEVPAEDILLASVRACQEGAGRDRGWELERLARAAARRALRGRETYTDDALLRLVETLRRADMPYTCPHGRPTVILMSYRELDRRFGRT